MIEPTITGFFRKPRRNCQRGLGLRRAERRTRRREPLRVLAVEGGKISSVRKSAVRSQMRRDLARFRVR
jgi:hypothetical protein